MLDLKDLEARLDRALEKETEESLNKWLYSLRLKRMGINLESKYTICFADNLMFEPNQNEKLVNDFIAFLPNIEGLAEIVRDTSGMPMLWGDKLCKPPDYVTNATIEEKKMTPYNTESFFFYNITS